MKNVLLTALILGSASTSFALKETKVATCQLLSQGGQAQVIGTMNILASDNGDEGFLRFSYVMSGDTTKNEFTDNVQDEGAAFLTPGATKLYVSLEGTKTSGKGTINAAAVYLQNKNGKITGLFKADFLQADVSCK